MTVRKSLRTAAVIAAMAGTLAYGDPAVSAGGSTSTDQSVLPASVLPALLPTDATPSPNPPTLPSDLTSTVPTSVPTSAPTPSPIPTPTPTPTPVTSTPQPTPTYIPPPPVTTPNSVPGSAGAPAPAPRPHPHKTLGPPAPQRPHPHRTLGPVPPQRAHPHRKPWPITITLVTVPPLKGVHFMFDKHRLVTNAAGQVTYTAEHDFLPHTLKVVDTTLQVGQRRYQFNRWAGQRNPNQAFLHAVSPLPLRQNYMITAGFTLQQQVIPRLVEENGTALDASRVSAITVKSDSGEVVNLSPASPVWLDGFRPVYHQSALKAAPATYSLQSVIVSGANVVDAGRQAFKPATDTNPTFRTQFHNLAITGHDALLKSAMGKQAIVTFPDGSKKTVPLDAKHTTMILNLPRGTYTVRITAGSGIIAATQFVLSKDKIVDVPVISILDLAILSAIAILLAVALVLIGRRRWRSRLIRKLRRPVRGEPLLAEQREEVLT